METQKEGQVKKVPDSDATIKWLTTPNNYSIYIENGTEKGTAVDLAF